MKAVPKRILVVDDNRDAAETLAVVLRFSGHEIRVAHDGKRAVELASDFCPDVVILDINMPVMDGYEAARRLRKAAGAELLLVAVTGVPARESKDRALGSGFDVHLSKPFDVLELEQLLEARQ
ncbi:response regulator [Aquabacterium sp. A7-Y]|uniref:response regulator n=1 Tax=Aquabacterium sp. A7-Y TaxID=1349605 RepID=UPI00223D1452|nr:response regulator [Aquabacterium sp. A7-Y]MCW7536837.1 response regulator [Aquabacterium sp. A7-Y]